MGGTWEGRMDNQYAHVIYSWFCTSLAISLSELLRCDAITRPLGRSISGAQSCRTRTRSRQWSHDSGRSMSRSWTSSGALNLTWTISAAEHLDGWHVWAVYKGKAARVAWALAELRLLSVLALISGWAVPICTTCAVWLGYLWPV